MGGAMTTITPEEVTNVPVEENVATVTFELDEPTPIVKVQVTPDESVSTIRVTVTTPGGDKFTITLRETEGNVFVGDLPEGTLVSKVEVEQTLKEDTEGPIKSGIVEFQSCTPSVTTTTPTPTTTPNEICPMGGAMTTITPEEVTNVPVEENVATVTFELDEPTPIVKVQVTPDESVSTIRVTVTTPGGDKFTITLRETEGNVFVGDLPEGTLVSKVEVEQTLKEDTEGPIKSGIVEFQSCTPSVTTTTPTPTTTPNEICPMGGAMTTITPEEVTNVPVEENVATVTFELDEPTPIVKVQVTPDESVSTIRVTVTTPGGDKFTITLRETEGNVFVGDLPEGTLVSKVEVEQTLKEDTEGPIKSGLVEFQSCTPSVTTTTPTPTTTPNGKR
ncbi:hypothetical protein MAR_012692 [Mya arenaria]|uniref:Uncharacterized protein n=1 Tax=Mya arenaria TaxID=6604 RepID=A0ABY7FXP5_MYAAR|nr:hypothetical protein MAR_012692 [Mya arenaria]